VSTSDHRTSTCNRPRAGAVRPRAHAEAVRTRAHARAPAAARRGWWPAWRRRRQSTRTRTCACWSCWCPGSTRPRSCMSLRAQPRQIRDSQSPLAHLLHACRLSCQLSHMNLCRCTTCRCLTRNKRSITLLWVGSVPLVCTADSVPQGGHCMMHHARASSPGGADHGRYRRQSGSGGTA